MRRNILLGGQRTKVLWHAVAVFGYQRFKPHNGGLADSETEPLPRFVHSSVSNLCVSLEIIFVTEDILYEFMVRQVFWPSNIL